MRPTCVSAASHIGKMADNPPVGEKEDGGSDGSNYSDLSGSEFGDEQVTWIEWFCHLKGNEFFVEVDDDYAQDDFNLTYLPKEMLDYYEKDVYREALNMILDYEEQEDELTEAQRPLIEQAAQCLYGLIHARFILTARGMAAMWEKFAGYVYGSCPLLDCHAQNQAVLPVGLSDSVGQGGTKVFCPRCKEIYNPKSGRLEVLDGAYFGTSFPHLFFLTYPNLKPNSPPRNYVPRIFGFKVSGRMKQAMRMVAEKQLQDEGKIAPAEDTPVSAKEGGEKDDKESD